MNYQQLLSEPLSADAACGQNLEDDAEFQNFFFLAQGTPERFDGENTIAAEPPDWRTVKKTALGYLEQSKDIKLMCVLAQAVLNTEGLPAFAECLQGLANLFEQHWTALYPPLDEDDGDPLERVAALAYLGEAFVSIALKNLPIASVRGLGTVSLSSLGQAGAIEDENTLSDSQVRVIFAQNSSEQLQLFHSAVTYSLASLSSINDSLVAQAGHEYRVDFSVPEELLTKMHRLLEEHADLGGQEDEPASGEDEIEQSGSTASLQGQSYVDDAHAQGTGGMRSATTVPGVISSRGEVERSLRAINDYYAKYEPSSPLPMLIGRALKLVNKDFFEVIKDIYPDALPALHQLGGITEDAPNVASESSEDDSW